MPEVITQFTLLKNKRPSGITTSFVAAPVAFVQTTVLPAATVFKIVQVASVVEVVPPSGVVVITSASATAEGVGDATGVAVGVADGKESMPLAPLLHATVNATVVAIVIAIIVAFKKCSIDTLRFKTVALRLSRYRDKGPD